MARHPARQLASIAVAVVLMASCGSGSSQSKVALGVPPTTAAPAPVGSTPNSAAGSTTTATAPDFNGQAPTVAAAATSLGTILVDGRGVTLYLFTKDSPSKSTCDDGCAGPWPPLTSSGPPTAGPGVDGSKLGTATRTDGTKQVTYAGRPLYRHAADRAPGDVTGEGIGNVWFAVLGSGQPALTSTQPAGPSPY